MHKKLAADLTSLAHSILQMKNKEDVFALKNKAYEVYEKLAVLAYVEEYINNTPNPEHTKEEILEKIESVVQEAAEVKEVEEVATEPESVQEEVVESVMVESAEEELQEEIQEETTEPEEQEEIIKYDLEEYIEEAPKVETQPEDAIEEVASEVELEATNDVDSESLQEEATEEEPVAQESTESKADKEEEVLVFDLEDPVEEKVEKKMPSLEEELQDTIAVDVVADLFENAPKKSLNDKLHGDIQIGLNDRIAFVKNLFDGSQEDFNRVVSQLNTFKTEKEAKKFINKMVKPDYNWSEKEEFEERFMTIVERKFA
jgi:hypothetical protein